MTTVSGRTDAAYVWNNDHDTATLRDDDLVLVLEVAGVGDPEGVLDDRDRRRAGWWRGGGGHHATGHHATQGGRCEVAVSVGGEHALAELGQGA
ncbi:hypothetical protein [Streptomyces sp. NPDC060002]|uniref:hypothetical protein n=1 Tax=Streptomyces sp. NPDC060002 TaxID=3347033 RepID=UPI0036897D34